MPFEIEGYWRGYLYSLWSGQLRIYEGSVIPGRGRRSDYGRAEFILERRFLDDGTFIVYQNKVEKTMSCSINPGEVMNAVVWLTERDDKRACDILIEYEKACIATLQEKIDGHKNKIRILENS